MSDDIKSPETNQENYPSIEQKLNECLIEKDEWKDRCLRTAADYENFKRRSEKERVLWITSTQAAMLNDLLSVVDDFDRAFANSSLRLSGSSDSASFGGLTKDQAGSPEGFQMIYKSFQKLLDKFGVQEIKEVAEFDPNLHEAIMQVESPDHQAGQIVQVLQKGYRFKDQILRPAKVSVAK